MKKAGDPAFCRKFLASGRTGLAELVAALAEYRLDRSLVTAAIAATQKRAGLLLCLLVALGFFRVDGFGVIGLDLFNIFHDGSGDL